ncbi:MAG TPA: protein kinase [Candidatus Saccharimonadales bacterium]|nr:protein kinase [Candidatus Saccharimonadales bacterium]
MAPEQARTVKPGQNLTHYRIERLIGQGGMGAVFLARDTNLNRNVALKVLPETMAADADRLARFRREAQTVAALNHPHIVTLHSVEEAEGIHFLTMELVEGSSLDRTLPPGGLPMAQVFDIGIALADALAAAHEKGIVHRDLKPANVMVTKDGRVKVLDFGLAKLAEEGTEGPTPASREEATSAPTATRQREGPLTSAGMVMGTVPYMSPEQVNGLTLDTRTDIFSLGVVLYEMATGQRPFGGKTPAETISSILRDSPRPVTDARQDAPRHLARIIDHCLQKDPEARFQTAKDVRNELRALRKEIESGESAIHTTGSLALPPSTVVTAGRSGRKGLWIGLGIVVVAAVAGVFLWTARAKEGSPPSPALDASATAAGSPGAGPDPKSIAVLPFVDMSQSKDQEYFSDGISEELLNLLAKVPGLKVAARTSSFSFKGKEVEITEIARQLHVAHVLEGSVRKSGDRVRITAQLIHAADGFHLWSETYDRKLDDVFKIQDEIASQVVAELKVTLLGEGPKTRTTDPQAYALYLQAVQLGRQATAEAFAKSDALLRQVLETDPRYAPAWNELSRNLINETVNFGLLSNREGLARARGAGEKALEIDPDYAPALARLAAIAIFGDNDLAGAAKQLERALALDPTDLDVLNLAAALLNNLGRLDEALAIREAVVHRDPVNVTTLFNLGNSQRWAGRYDAAIDTYRTVLSLSPGRGGTHFVLGLALLQKGDPAGALIEFEKEPNEGWRMIGLPLAYHALGRKADSDRALAELIAKHEKETAYNIASIYAFRGEADQAFEWLEKELQNGGSMAEVVPENLFDRIHSDPRWLPFLRKVGMAPDQLARIEFHVPLPT